MKLLFTAVTTFCIAFSAFAAEKTDMPASDKTTNQKETAMTQNPVKLTNAKILTDMDWGADPARQPFAEKGKAISLDDDLWNLEEYTGKTVNPKKCVMIRAEFEAPQDGMYVLGSDADYWYKIWIDGVKIVDATGVSVPPDTRNDCHRVPLKAGKHVVTISFSRGNASAAMAFSLRFFDTSAQVLADLNKATGKIRKELHGSNTTLILSSRNLSKYDEKLKKLNFCLSRTHDWALWNGGQRIIDTHFIFPLMKLDPKDPTNYYFAPTDEIIRLTQDVAGMKVFYRLGTSIEHTGNPHFNAVPPEDYEKYAEVLAGIVRHYTKGWANGFHYDIKYWEIWNEPDGKTNMWTAEFDTFIPFFVTVLKRLKSEFPELQFGGPAMISLNPKLFIPLLKACKDAGVAPDFISWHHYGTLPNALILQPYRGRKMLDDMGFTGTKLCINEWHYIESWEGVWYATTPAKRQKARDSQNGIHSGVYNLAVLIGWQDSPLDLAMWYGSSWDSPSWGYRNISGYNKNYYSLEMFGSFIREYPVKCGTKACSPVYALAARSEDGTKAGLLVAAFKDDLELLEIQVEGLASYPKISATALDETHNNESFPVEVKENKIILKKSKVGSAAFLIRLEK